MGLLQEGLQTRCNAVGLNIASFEITDLAYPKEIAGLMLVKQHAEATLAARRIIAEGAVKIASETLRLLEEDGITVNGTERSELVRSLLVVSMNDHPAQASLNL